MQSESDISRNFSQEVGSAVLLSADLQLAPAFSRWEGGISRSLANAHNLTYTSPKATGQQRYLASLGFFFVMSTELGKMINPVAEVIFGVLCNFSLFLTFLSLPLDHS